MTDQRETAAFVLGGASVTPLLAAIVPLASGLSPDQALVFAAANTLAVLILATSVYFKFRVIPDIEDHLILPFPILSAVLFFFAAGGRHYNWPFPGAIWLTGLILLSFVAGYGLRAAIALRGVSRPDSRR